MRRKEVGLRFPQKTGAFSLKINTVITYKYEGLCITKSNPQLTIKLTNPSIVEDAAIYEPPEKIARFRELLRTGDAGYYAYIGNAWVHRSWVSIGPKTVFLWRNVIKFNISKDEAFIHSCETVPEARGQQIYPSVIARICSDLSDKKNIYISTTKENIRSINGIQKAGFKEIQRSFVISFLRWHIIFKV